MLYLGIFLIMSSQHTIKIPVKAKIKKFWMHSTNESTYLIGKDNTGIQLNTLLINCSDSFFSNRHTHMADCDDTITIRFSRQLYEMIRDFEQYDLIKCLSYILNNEFNKTLYRHIQAYKDVFGINGAIDRFLTAHNLSVEDVNINSIRRDYWERVNKQNTNA